MFFQCCVQADPGLAEQTAAYEVDEVGLVSKVAPRSGAVFSLEVISTQDLEPKASEPAAVQDRRKISGTTSLNFDQNRDEEFEIAGREEGDVGGDLCGAAARNTFGGRSATSRGFETRPSTWSLDQQEIIDPSGGLRRKTSVAVAHGDIHLKYNTEIKLGEGSFGTVMRVTDIMTKQAFALKIICVQNLKDTQRFEQELAISRRLRHPNIITLHETFMEGAAYHLVMEMCTGGDLHGKIMGRAAVPGNVQVGMPARRVAVYAWQMLAGVAYLHHYCFVHRDIKPENYLLSDSTDGATIKLIDFGLARECRRAEKMTSLVGTPHYVAPEVVADTSTGYIANCDVWSIGVTLWFVSIGSLPFVGKDPTATLKAVVRGKYDFSSPLWAVHNHPPELMQIIGRMLLKDAELRPHAKSIMRDDAWLKANAMLADSKKADACCNIA